MYILYMHKPAVNLWKYDKLTMQSVIHTRIGVKILKFDAESNIHIGLNVSREILLQACVAAL